MLYFIRKPTKGNLMANGKNKKRLPKVGDNDPRTMRVNQRAQEFVDRKKKANKDACDKRNWHAA